MHGDRSVAECFVTKALEQTFLSYNFGALAAHQCNKVEVHALVKLLMQGQCSVKL